MSKRMARKIKLTKRQKQTIDKQSEVKAIGMLLDAFLLVKGNDFAVTRLCEYASSLAKTALSAMFIEDGYRMIHEIGLRIEKSKKDLKELTKS